jgi:cytochrome c peroxidase
MLLLGVGDAARAGAGSRSSRERPIRSYAAWLVSTVRDHVEAHGIQPLPAPPPVSAELFELGRALAFDKLLSGNRNIACLTCHHPELGSDDDRHLPLGEGGSGLGAERSGGPIIPRNAPALFNLHAYETMFWDSRVERAEGGALVTPAGDQLTPEMEAVLKFGLVAAQALFPVTSREEMRGLPGDNEIADVSDGDFQGIWAALMERLAEVPEYVDMFEAAYPSEHFEHMTFAHAANAIGAFEVAAFDSRDSPWERFLAGDDRALSLHQLLGAALFFETGCAGCHQGSRFSDFGHHNTCLVQFGPGKGDGPDGRDDYGRERVTGDPADRYAFRTQPLFNVELTAPYGHTGQFSSLRAYIRHYADPARVVDRYKAKRHVHEKELWDLMVDNHEALLDGADPALDELGLADRRARANLEIRLIEKFLKALTDPSAKDLDALVPDSVPSGLPVSD